MATNFLELATTLTYLGAKWLPEKKVYFTPWTIHWMFCYIFRLSIEQSYHKNKQRRRAGNNCAIESRSGYIWVWSEARDHESANLGAHFIEWKSSYITIKFVLLFSSAHCFYCVMTSILETILLPSLLGFYLFCFMQINQFLGKPFFETNSGISRNLWQFVEGLCPLLSTFRNKAIRG